MSLILKDIIYKVAIEAVKGSTDIAIHKVHFDSRNLTQNDVFVAIRGTVSDGHDYIEKAIELGAVAVVCVDLPEILAPNITYIQVQDTNTALAFIAANYYGNPSKKLKLIGITGTNGKTTIASLLYQLFKKAGYKVGLLSTVKIMVDDQEYKATHTTPDSLTINYYLEKMIQEGVGYCFMEVSSHGIHQKRTEALHFEGGVFTNLSHDHLDYHATFVEYRDVKKSFFDSLTKGSFALSNIDDKNGLVMLQNTGAKKLMCIRVLGNNRKYANIGDIIIGVVKDAIPNMAVKRSNVVRAVIVRTKNTVRREDGMGLRFDDNAVVIINAENNPRGTRVFGPVAREIRDKNFTKIISLATEVV